MKTHTETIKFYLMAKLWTDGEVQYNTFSIDMSEYGYILVTTKEVEVLIDIPEGFDPVTGQVDSLKKEKQKIGAEAQLKMNNIDEQIQSLLAIEFQE